ncbi:MAG: Hsp20/alpha crystallin family protein [Proteobacteria bacterium]|nr:Hsp20/alpha crystallin family protein [Pseudomonadota bacterium]
MLLSLRNGHRPLDIFENIFNDPMFHYNKEYSDFVLENDQYSLEVPLAGFKKENIDLTTNQEYLTIKATRKEGKVKYEKSFYLPREVDLSEVKAKHEDGLLTITFGKENRELQNKIKID